MKRFLCALALGSAAACDCGPHTTDLSPKLQVLQADDATARVVAVLGVVDHREPAVAGGHVDPRLTRLLLPGRRPLDRNPHVPLWGTAEFMAPEHASRRVDRRGDIYSVGCILYLTVSRRLPFVAESAEAVMAHLRRQFQDPDLEKEVGLLWLGEEFAQLDTQFCGWKRSSSAACSPEEINRSAFVAWIDCQL